MSLDIASVSQALAEIKAFPQRVQTANDQFQTANLGPWTAKVKCTTFWGVHFTYSYHIDSGESRNQLGNLTVAISNRAHSLLETLMKQISTLHAYQKSIQTKLENLKKEVQKPGEISKNLVLAGLGNVIQELINLESKLKTSESSMAKLREQINSYMETLSPLVGELQNNIESKLSKMKDEAIGQSCGTESITAQLDAITTEFTATAGVFQSVTNTLNTQTFKVSNSNGVMIGAFTNFITDLSGVLRELKLADTPEKYNRVLSGFDIKVAIDMWNDLGKQLAKLS